MRLVWRSLGVGRDVFGWDGWDGCVCVFEGVGGWV